MANIICLLDESNSRKSHQPKLQVPERTDQVGDKMQWFLDVFSIRSIGPSITPSVIIVLRIMINRQGHGYDDDEFDD